MAVGASPIAAVASSSSLSALRAGSWRRGRPPGELATGRWAAARLSLGSLECGPTSFESLPDNVQGAYVFRNGFPEALRREGTLLSGTASCRLIWDGERFSAR